MFCLVAFCLLLILAVVIVIIQLSICGLDNQAWQLVFILTILQWIQMTKVLVRRCDEPLYYCSSSSNEGGSLHSWVLNYVVRSVLPNKWTEISPFLRFKQYLLFSDYKNNTRKRLQNIQGEGALALEVEKPWLLYILGQS